MPQTHDAAYENLVFEVFFASALCISIFLVVRTWTQRPLPPGPKRRFIIGNLLNMPSQSPWIEWAKWRKVYGDVVYTETLGQPMVILNSYQAANELLDKRPIYSDRPNLTVVELTGWTFNPAVMRYNDVLKKHRAILHNVFGSAAVLAYMPLQVEETHLLLKQLLDAPQNFISHLKRWAGGSAMSIAYGYKVHGDDDPYLVAAEAALKGFGVAVIPGRFLVESIPWLRYIPEWIPGAGFQKQMRTWYEQSQAMLHKPYEDTVKKLNGEGHTSMMSRLLEENTDDTGTLKNEDIIRNCLAVTYAGGFETTVSTLLSFILAMVMYPEVQARAHEEIDRIIGPHRLPNFDDRPLLPYVNAIIKECLRWNPVSPIGMIHKVMKEDTYNGYRIPTGSSVAANVWGILHDETEYPLPMEFRPERFLTEAGQRTPMNPNKAAFGFGRRICPGRHFADNSVFIAVACMLAVFDFKKALDEHGKPVDPVCRFTPTALSQPEPFECTILPRSAASVDLISTAAEKSRLRS